MPRQWTLGFHYRRKYSEKAVLTYQFDYYRAAEFGVHNYTFLYGMRLWKMSIGCYNIRLDHYDDMTLFSTELTLEL